MRSSTFKAVKVFCALVLVVMGSAIPVPLLPLYRVELDLSSNRIAMVFGAYLATMVVALAVASIQRFNSNPKRTLCLSLAASIIADVLFLVGTEMALVVARVVTGLSVGFGLGSAASLSVMLVGERGRSVAATSTMVAGFVGILGSAVIADYFPRPTTTPFLTHIVLASLVLVLLATTRLPKAGEVASVEFRQDGAPPRSQTKVSTTTQVESSAVPRLPIFVCASIGVVAWSLGNVVVGLTPSLIQESMNLSSLLGASFVALLVTGLGVVGQYGMAPSRLVGSTAMAGFALFLGAISMIVGVYSGWLALILLGGALIGVGQGAGYRTGMLAVTQRLPPPQHGARVSIYACAAYIAAAFSVQISGLMMASIGDELGLGVFLITVQITLVFLGVAGVYQSFMLRPRNIS